MLQLDRGQGYDHSEILRSALWIAVMSITKNLLIQAKIMLFIAVINIVFRSYSAKCFAVLSFTNFCHVFVNTRYRMLFSASSKTCPSNSGLSPTSTTLRILFTLGCRSCLGSVLTTVTLFSWCHRSDPSAVDCTSTDWTYICPGFGTSESRFWM